MKSVLVDLFEVTVSPRVGVVGRYEAFESSCQIESGRLASRHRPATNEKPATLQTYNKYSNKHSTKRRRPARWEPTPSDAIWSVWRPLKNAPTT